MFKALTKFHQNTNYEDNVSSIKFYEELQALKKNCVPSKLSNIIACIHRLMTKGIIRKLPATT
jgi:hypothetical protein